MRELIERCRENLNLVRVGDHHGFYKHADVEALLSSHSALLEALEQLLGNAEVARFHLHGSEGAEIVGSALFDTISQARAAIAKATGADQ